MIKKGIPELKFPPYEKIKALDKNKEYEFILFYTGITETYGRFTVHEDGKRKIIFDLILFIFKKFLFYYYTIYKIKLAVCT